jgi:hypothetical protein
MQFKFQRYHIAPLVLFLVLVGSIVGVYQFYFKEQLEIYAENQAKRDTLVDIVNRLEVSFRGEGGVGDPEEMVAKTRQRVRPYADAVDRRARFFNIDGMEDFAPVPEGDIPRFHYQEEMPRVWEELRQNARDARTVMNEGINFEVPFPQDLAGRQVTRQQVHNWLRRFSFGASVAQVLFDANARQVHAINLWPDREDPLLRYRTVGLSFTMELNDLARFLERLELEDSRFINVNGFRITNPNLLTGGSPQLSVEMLITFGIYKDDTPGQMLPDAPATAGPQMPIVARGGGTQGDVQDMLATLQARRAESGGAAERRELTLWQRWRPYVWPF